MYICEYLGRYSNLSVNSCSIKLGLHCSTSAWLKLRMNHQVYGPIWPFEFLWMTGLSFVVLWIMYLIETWGWTIRYTGPIWPCEFLWITGLYLLWIVSRHQLAYIRLIGVEQPIGMCIFDFFWVWVTCRHVYIWFVLTCTLVVTLQYGRIVDIELKTPPRPPGYAFVEVS